MTIKNPLPSKEIEYQMHSQKEAEIYVQSMGRFGIR